MSSPKTLQHEGERIRASLKTVILITVIGIIASVLVAFEAPPLIVAPDEPVTMMAAVVLNPDQPAQAPSIGTQVSTETGAQTDQHAAGIASK